MPARREYPDMPMLAVGALLVRDGRLLLVKRNTPPKRGYWGVPGGLVERGEPAKRAVERETMEETGLAVRVGDLLAAVDDIQTDPRGRVRYHFLILDFDATPLDEGVRLNEESSAWGWFRSADIEKLRMARALKWVALRSLGASRPPSRPKSVAFARGEARSLPPGRPRQTVR